MSISNEDYCTLAGYITDYNSYMVHDFCHITTVCDQEGPRAALNLLLLYRKDSWLGLNAHIRFWCSCKGISVPYFYIEWWAYQKEQELYLRSLIRRSSILLLWNYKSKWFAFLLYTILVIVLFFAVWYFSNTKNPFLTTSFLSFTPLYLISLS